MYSAILLSGGKGKRMMKEVPKQYLLLAGKPIIMHSIERLDHLKQVDEIIIVCEDEYFASIQSMIRQYNIETSIKFTCAGSTRQESVYNGLQFVKNTDVIIHEAARPFVTELDYQRLIDADSPNVILGYSIPFTVVKGAGVVTDILDRSELVNVQLPQKYETAVLMNAHNKAIRDKKIFTEDASMVFYYLKVPVQIIEGTSYNLKITEPIDLLICEIIYRECMVLRNY